MAQRGWDFGSNLIRLLRIERPWSIGVCGTAALVDGDQSPRRRTGETRRSRANSILRGSKRAGLWPGRVSASCVIHLGQERGMASSDIGCKRKSRSRWGSPWPESSKDGVPGARRRRPAARAAVCSRTGRGRASPGLLSSRGSPGGALQRGRGVQGGQSTSGGEKFRQRRSSPAADARRNPGAGVAELVGPEVR